jgi:hypothetical protein
MKKPMNTPSASTASTAKAVSIESVANILERESRAVTQDWFSRVELETDLTAIPLTFEERTRHLRPLLHEVVARLRLDTGSKAPVSKAASAHGGLRQTQGYTAAMTVQESRLLQVSIFFMLHKYVRCLDFSTLLPDVAIIADEVDAQLKQHIVCFMAV